MRYTECYSDSGKIVAYKCEKGTIWVNYPLNRYGAVEFMLKNWKLFRTLADAKAALERGEDK